MSNHPLDREYNVRYGLHIDVNVLDIGPAMISLLHETELTFISLHRDVKLEGRSWEMAAALSIIGVETTASGTLEEVSDGVLAFGPVPGIDVKKTLSPNLLTYNELHSIVISR
uniref:Uncharacterized protein n=1 Tax=viral metagenome TaxID=1070528 RepID=A0A2V0RA90_9ZZZZ